MQSVLVAMAAIALLAVLRALGETPPIALATANAVGSNFIVYRNAVEAYYAVAPGAGPTVANSELSTPDGYRPIRPWQNLRLSGGLVFVYGPATVAALAALVDEHGPRLGSVGLVQGGRLISPVYGDLGVNVPVSIPSGSLAAAIQPN